LVAYPARLDRRGRVNELDRSDLVAEREFLTRSIADLDAERAAGDLASDDFDDLRDAYVARAAVVARALEDDAPPAAPVRTGNARRNAFVVVACLAIAGLAGAALAAAVGSRSPGAPATGSLPTTNSDRLARAEALVQQGKVLDALKAYDAIIKSDPKNAAALAERGWVTHSVPGFEPKGLEYIDRAIAADPSYAEAHFFRGMIVWKDNKDPAAAVAEFRLFLANSPSGGEADTVKAMLRQAAAEAGIPVE
jgi:tetratricopeptide (TPR) repeat protein